jgi:AraC-like DNA-binding protein
MLAARSWSTDHVQSGDRVGYWRQAIREAMFQLDFEAPAKPLDARISQYDLGALMLSSVSINTAHQVTRTHAGIARNKVPRFNLNYIRSGSWKVEHCGREIALQTGEIILLDPRQPYRVSASAGTEHLCLHLPIEWLRCWIPDPESAVARPIKLGSPWRAALAATLDETPMLSETAPGASDLCAAQIAGALALALGPSASQNTSHTRLIFLRILRAIADRFHDHTLDASQIAAAMSISPRYLHKILARENTTYGRELIRIRLEKAASMLRDERFAKLSISEIGWRCGFCDPSHFSKRFREAHDKTPGAFRMAPQATPAANAGFGALWPNPASANDQRETAS